MTEMGIVDMKTHQPGNYKIDKIESYFDKETGIMTLILHFQIENKKPGFQVSGQVELMPRHRTVPSFKAGFEACLKQIARKIEQNI